MSQSLLELAMQLTQAGKPFVLATVVWCERPTSAKPGAQALIADDGQMIGWVGGSCTQPIVLREAKRLLREGGEPFLLRLGTSGQAPTQAQPGVLAFPMTCASGGALDIYMEPHLPLPQLLLIGDSPIITALQQLASVLDFSVACLNDTNLSSVHIDERTCLVIATHGQYDENILEQVLGSPAAYIGLVSSQRRAAACRDYLQASGMSAQHIARLHAPAGLDLGAVTPAEIATSILAQLIQLRRQPTSQGVEQRIPRHVPDRLTEPTSMTSALDLVCGMSVEVASARHTSKYHGQLFYFCCPSCKREFERAPEHFLAVSEG